MLGSCALQRSTPPVNVLGPPAVNGGGTVQVGCTFNGRQLLGAPGSTFQIGCPPGCVDRAAVSGTDVYTIDSGLCVAGIHAGAISKDGGTFAVRLDEGQIAYRGSLRNGVLSTNDGSSRDGSFTVAALGHPPAAAPEAIQATCSFDRTQIKDAYGTAHLVSCPPGCAQARALWGTNVYSGDSSICKAAIHAGILSDAGGEVVVVLAGWQPAFQGGARNQVRSGDYGPYPSSFLLQPAR
jgi:hypothetical protein